MLQIFSQEGPDNKINKKLIFTSEAIYIKNHMNQWVWLCFSRIIFFRKRMEDTFTTFSPHLGTKIHFYTHIKNKELNLYNIKNNYSIFSFLLFSFMFFFLLYFLPLHPLSTQGLFLFKFILPETFSYAWCNYATI